MAYEKISFGFFFAGNKSIFNPEKCSNISKCFKTVLLIQTHPLRSCGCCSVVRDSQVSIIGSFKVKVVVSASNGMKTDQGDCKHRSMNKIRCKEAEVYMCDLNNGVTLEMLGLWYRIVKI